MSVGPWLSDGQRQLFDALPDPALLVVQPTACIADANAAACRVLGFALHELQGRPLSDLACSTEPAHTLSTGTQPLLLGQGRPHGLVILRDASRHQQAEQALLAQIKHWRQSAFDAVRAQAIERDRIAAGLHDEIGQMLAMMGFKLGELGALVEPGAGQLLLGELRTLLRQAAQAARTATFELSNPVLEQLGLKPALESVAQAIEKARGLRVRIVGDAPVLGEPQRGVVYRVVRELLLNVQKHAQARQVSVSLQPTGQGAERGLLVEVSDDGQGFDIASGARRFGPDGGYGLVNARCQIQAVGGTISLQSAPGQGTRAEIRLPVLGRGMARRSEEGED